MNNLFALRKIQKRDDDERISTLLPKISWLG